MLDWYISAVTHSIPFFLLLLLLKYTFQIILTAPRGNSQYFGEIRLAAIPYSGTWIFTKYFFSIIRAFSASRVYWLLYAGLSKTKREDLLNEYVCLVLDLLVFELLIVLNACGSFKVILLFRINFIWQSL